MNKDDESAIEPSWCTSTHFHHDEGIHGIACVSGATYIILKQMLEFMRTLFQHAMECSFLGKMES